MYKCFKFSLVYYIIITSCRKLSLGLQRVGFLYLALLNQHNSYMQPQDLLLVQRTWDMSHLLGVQFTDSLCIKS